MGGASDYVACEARSSGWPRLCVSYGCVPPLFLEGSGYPYLPCARHTNSALNLLKALGRCRGDFRSDIVRSENSNRAS